MERPSGKPFHCAAASPAVSDGKDVLYQNVTYTGRGSGHYYGEAAGLVTFDGCKFDIHGYAVHFGGESSPEDDVVIKNCEINGWSSFGACKSLTISDSHFGGANDEGKNGWFAVLRPYCPTTITNCTFSDMYIHTYPAEGYYLVGLATGAAATVIVNDCKIVNDSKQEITGAEIYSIVREDAFDNAAAQNGSVFAFDATGNATDGYTAGTFYAKQASNIKAAQGFKIVAVEGKDNIWTTAPVEYKTTLLRGNEVFGQYETIADAVKAFNFDENITAGDYTLNIKPGTYNEDMILLIQDPTEGKIRTLTVQPSDSTEKVTIKSTSSNPVALGFSAESSYSGGAIEVKNITIDISENNNDYPYAVYFAGSQSNTPETIFPELTTNQNRRYCHKITFDGCTITGKNNSKCKAFYSPNGASTTAIEVASNFVGLTQSDICLHENRSKRSRRRAARRVSPSRTC